MSDSITVRVTVDSYDALYPSQRQTQVYVQIPEVARASWLLPVERYEGLKDRAWPEVMDVSVEHFARGWVSPDPASAVARQAVMEWLRDDANRDEMQAAYEEEQARRNPVARKLLARVAELETDRAANDREYETATARIAELETEREKLVRWHGEDSDAITKLVARIERRRARLVALQNDALSMRGSLAPADGDRKVPFELGETLTPAVEWLIARVAELEAAQADAVDVSENLYSALHEEKLAGSALYAALTMPTTSEQRQAALDRFHKVAQKTGQLHGSTQQAAPTPVTVYRASHNAIVMGLYTTAAEARAHCVAEERRAWSASETPVFDWVEDEDDGTAELVTVDEDGEPESFTGYVVTPLEVAAEYDPDGDE